MKKGMKVLGIVALAVLVSIAITACGEVEDTNATITIENRSGVNIVEITLYDAVGGGPILADSPRYVGHRGSGSNSFCGLTNRNCPATHVTRMPLEDRQIFSLGGIPTDRRYQVMVTTGTKDARNDFSFPGVGTTETFSVSEGEKISLLFNGTSLERISGTAD